MKTIYELCYRTESGLSCNVLFSSLEKAKKSLQDYYYVGACSPLDGSFISDSSILDRLLF